MTASLRLVAASARPEEPWLLGGAVRYRHGEHDGLTDLSAESLAAHVERWGHLPALDAGDVLHRLETAELSGRGGGSFPVARKWRAARRSPGRAIVIGNGAESEPLSRKDAAVLELRPHLVLDGLTIAAHTVGADEAVVWLHEDAYAARSAVTRALAERAAHRWDPVPARVEVAPARYLSGEASSIAQALSGGPALPRFQQQPLAVQGVGGRATVVQNIETLARVALLVRDVEASTSRLLTVVGDRDLVVVEARGEATLHDAVHASVGASRPAAVLMGGYGGAWAPWAQVAGLPVDEAALRRHGLSLGAGILLPLGAGCCGLDVTARIARYLADSGARQCGPCLFGLPAVATTLEVLLEGDAGRRDLRRLERHLGEIAGRGACHHPDGAVRMIASALTTFAADVTAHLRGRCVEAGR